MSENLPTLYYKLLFDIERKFHRKETKGHYLFETKTSKNNVIKLIFEDCKLFFTKRQFLILEWGKYGTQTTMIDTHLEFLNKCSCIIKTYMICKKQVTSQ